VHGAAAAPHREVLGQLLGFQYHRHLPAPATPA
jgi:hypothetical protein